MTMYSMRWTVGGLIICSMVIVGKSAPFWVTHDYPVDYVPSGIYDTKADRLLSFISDTVSSANHSHKLESRISNLRKERTLPLFLVRFLSIFELNRVVRELETSTMSHLSCTVCKFGVGIVKYFLNLGLSHHDIAELITSFCSDLHIQTERVCVGIVNSYQDVFLNALDQTKLTVQEICGVVVGNNCGNVSSKSNWTVDLPPTPKPPIRPVLPPQPGSPVLKVLHISDTHIDLNYHQGMNADCGEPLCCRITSGPPKNKNTSCGKWGDYHKCDPPLIAFENMLQFISQHHHIDYVLWTGDLPPHDVWNQTRFDQLLNLQETTKVLMKYFPKTPIFPAVGNHESAPANNFPPPSVVGNDSVTWLYDALSKVWANWLPQYTRPTIRKGAFYSVLVSPGFRIISLNSNYCNNLNWLLLLNTTDPADQLQWLVYELQYAEYRKEKVHIIGHIPPGSDDCMKIWSDNYYKIVNRYESTIVGQFYGHTHADEFELFFDEVDHKRPTSMAYIGPSVTSYAGLNPAFRIYSVDGRYANSTYAVLDHENYMMDLGDANLHGVPQWLKLYSAKDAYKLPSLQPKYWNNLVQLMQTNDVLFQRYYKYYHRASRAFPPCDKKCRFQLLCAMKTGRSHDLSQCDDLRRPLRRG